MPLPACHLCLWHNILIIIGFFFSRNFRTLLKIIYGSSFISYASMPNPLATSTTFQERLIFFSVSLLFLLDQSIRLLAELLLLIKVYFLLYFQVFLLALCIFYQEKKLVFLTILPVHRHMKVNNLCY